MTHPQSGVSSTDVIKKSLGLSFAEIIENAQKMSAKRPMSSPTISPVVKKIRVHSGDHEAMRAGKTLELREVKDSGLICVTCKSDEENNIDEDDESSLMQSITELQHHILLKHRDIVVNDNFVYIQNRAAAPHNTTFAYYLCTICGKCFSKTSPVEKLRHHVSKECTSTNNNETVQRKKTVERVKTDIISSIRNNNENLAQLLKEISPSVTIIPKPATSRQPLDLSKTSRMKRKEHCPCEFCSDPRYADVKLHKCYVDTYCEKTFSKIAHLKAHIRSHNNERPYECEWSGCGKTFVRSDELKRHAWIHTKEDRY